MSRRLRAVETELRTLIEQVELLCAEYGDVEPGPEAAGLLQEMAAEIDRLGAIAARSEEHERDPIPGD